MNKFTKRLLAVLLTVGVLYGIEATVLCKVGAVIASVVEEDYRIVLTWGADPRDLDSHLIGAANGESPFHVYYVNKSAPGVNLDVDDTDGYGPETITISRDGRYTYYVQYYSGDGTVASSGAVVKLYKGNTLLRTYNTPTNGGIGIYWNIFEIYGDYIHDLNYITDVLPTLDGDNSSLPGAATFNNYFTSLATTYNHEMALTAMQLSWLAYNDEGNSPKNVKVESALYTLGFSHDNISTKGSYDVVNSYPDVKHVVAYTFGVKTVVYNRVQTNLVAIVIRGTNGAEWYSNFAVGTGTIHEGFNKAYIDLRNNLEDFLGAGFDYANTKFFITGHSRGAAVANLIAADLSGNWTNLGAERTNVFAYTFATPNVAKVSELEADTYRNIFNFVNAEDMIPYMPFAKWGFWKYGKTFLMNHGDMSTYVAGVKYKVLTGDDYITKNDGGTSIQGFIDDISEEAATVDDYYNKRNPLDGRTPYEWFLLLAAYEAKNIDAVEFFNNAGLRGWFYYLAANTFSISLPIVGRIFSNDTISDAHKQETYLAWLQTYGSSVRNHATFELVDYYVRSALICCPIDFEVYDANNQLVGKVVNNEVLDELTRGIYISISGDQKKVVMPANQNYTIKMNATDNGILDYTVKDINAITGETDKTKLFANVTLTPNKTFISTVSGNIDTTDVRLFVTNSDGTLIAEVNTNGFEISTTGGGGGNGKPDEGLKLGAIAGIVIGSVAVIGALSFAVYWLLIKKRKTNSNNKIQNQKPKNKKQGEQKNMEKIINLNALSSRIKNGVEAIKNDGKKKKLFLIIVAVVVALAILLPIIITVAQPPQKKTFSKFTNAFNQSDIEKIADTVYFAYDEEREYFVSDYKDSKKTDKTEYKVKLKSFKVVEKYSDHAYADVVLTLSEKFVVDEEDEYQLLNASAAVKIKIHFIKSGTKWYIDSDSLDFIL
ncbi:MAG: hypothetical protein LBT20_02030 [Clostridiales bacterium]|jgi:hypothetical protein|nr:hypothetical protein [Clostridiales bacterium]